MIYKEIIGGREGFTWPPEDAVFKGFLGAL
jgi:hypothetical protein